MAHSGSVDDQDSPSAAAAGSSVKSWLQRRRRHVHSRLSAFHASIPYVRKLPLAVIVIVSSLILVNLVVWAICGLILSSHTHLLSTAALAYTLGLRHALDADHISAIDLMTRRLIATGQRPVTVGTFFSLGHSTIVVITSIVVAATAAGIAGRFDSFGTVGGIIGTSVSAAFLILLGIMNAYILYKLVVQIKKVIRMRPEQEAEEAWKIEGGGCLFRVLKKMFKLIDRPWKMYPLGVLFGMGFDTSSEIALLGISSIQGAKGTSIWLIMIFPVLFTAGMCLVDTIDGALMMSLYVAPMGMGGDETSKKGHAGEEAQNHRPAEQIFTTTDEPLILVDVEQSAMQPAPPEQQQQQQQQELASAGQQPTAARVKDPLTFLYYSIVLTSLTVLCAVIIGMLQLLSLILNVASPRGPFWDGVAKAGDLYEVIGGAICGSFVVVGGISVLCYKPWRRWVDRERERLRGAVPAVPARGDFDAGDEEGIVTRVEDSARGPAGGRGGDDLERGAVFVREEELVSVDGKGKTMHTHRERVGGQAL
ncbi:high-affinity nickel-transporter [Cladophialophora psammophila CBS 110553]|uniref:High-affinity nickel-transporter n=1 Tax=Cladophialophora psammophila CBS 110553 TaxID=1182543 RepID=W9WVY9_9EURO|nr:high-affinity nickel-transporter [Cladophialophora psammophila CBS 110553]EXJ69235.1 high-affinity nickel-transporter [Cladophialophora psammophila CBS 110553]